MVTKPEHQAAVEICAPSATPSSRHSISASLAAFAWAGYRPATPLQRAITTALVIKICVIIGLRILLSVGDMRVSVTSDGIGNRFIGPVTTDHSRP